MSQSLPEEAVRLRTFATLSGCLEVGRLGVNKTGSGSIRISLNQDISIYLERVDAVALHDLLGYALHPGAVAK